MVVLAVLVVDFVHRLEFPLGYRIVGHVYLALLERIGQNCRVARGFGLVLTLWAVRKVGFVLVRVAVVLTLLFPLIRIVVASTVAPLAFF